MGTQFPGIFKKKRSMLRLGWASALPGLSAGDGS